MKQFIFLILTGILSVFFFTTVEAATLPSSPGTAKVRTNAYLYPDMSADTIYYIWEGDELIVYGRLGDFALVAYPWQSSKITPDNMVYCWIPISAVSTGSSIPSVNSFFLGTDGYVNTPGSTLKLRCQPSFNKLLTVKGKSIEVIGVLPNRTPLKLHFTMGPWVYVSGKINGKEVYGFVYGEHVKVNDVKSGREKQVIDLAKNLKKGLDKQGGPQVFTKSNISSVFLCMKAIHEVKVQTSYNSLIIDMTSASVKAAVEAAKAASTGGISLLPAISDTIIDVAKDVPKSILINQLDNFSLDDQIYSAALKSSQDLRSQCLELVSLHYRSDLENYNDAANYLLLYQSIRMNSRTVRLGLDYFTSQLPQNFIDSLTVIIRNSISNLLPDSGAYIVDMANKGYDIYINSNIPLLREYANDMMAFAKETKQLIGAE